MTAMLTLTATAEAEVKVAEAFSSHMVLQREKPVSVWGVADAGEKVKVSFGKQTLSTTADNDGLWRVTLKAMPANSKPQVMSISGRKNKIRLTDVLVGEVWLASGQSNMEYSMNNHPRYRKPQRGDADYQLKAWREASINTSALISSKLSGKTISLIEEQLRKAPLPIVFMPSDNLTTKSEVQSINASAPIFLTVPGTIISYNREQPLKAFLSIEVTLTGIEYLSSSRLFTFVRLLPPPRKTNISSFSPAIDNNYFKFATNI